MRGRSLQSWKKELAERLGSKVGDILTRAEAARLIGKHAKHITRSEYAWKYPRYYKSGFRRGNALYFRGEITFWATRRSTWKEDYDNTGARLEWPDPAPMHPYDDPRVDAEMERLYRDSVQWELVAPVDPKLRRE